MPLTKVRSKWVGGDLIFHDKTDESSSGYVLRIAENEVSLMNDKVVFHSWGVVQDGSSYYFASDYGAYINSWKAGGLEVCASSDVRLHVGGKGWNVDSDGILSSAYGLTCTGVVNISAGRLLLQHLTDPLTTPSDEGAIWYNATQDKLQFSKAAGGVETVTSS